MPRPFLLALSLLVAALAACAPTAASPTPTATPEPTPRAEPTIGGDLVAMLPTEVGGITLEYQSMSGAEMVAEEGVTPELEAFLESTGASLDDISIAIGFGVNAETGGVITIFASRVAGADSDQLAAEMEAAMQAEAENAQISEGSLGGKDVTIVATGDGPEQQRSYVYVRGDTVFVVSATSDELSEEALRKLP